MIHDEGKMISSDSRLQYSWFFFLDSILTHYYRSPFSVDGRRILHDRGGPRQKPPIGFFYASYELKNQIIF